MAQLFNSFIDLSKSPNPNLRSREAVAWFKEQASSIRSINTQQLLVKSRENARNQMKVGQMYMFAYDAKHKDTLPYYDRYPLIFPFRRYNKGFYGINLHYLPIQLRAVLMDRLFDTVNNTKFDETTRLKLSYKLLNSSSRFKYFKPCVKHYLNSQMDSRLIYIPPEEWQVAIFLPLQRFKGVTNNTVYNDSRRSLMG